MTAAELSVRRLRLVPQGMPRRANEPPSWLGVAARVEDALRVSSKPPALLNRHLLVRRLRLRAAPGASAQSLALLLERAWLRIASVAQPIGSAGANADAVWAESEAAARVALIGRWARGADASAWFWQRIAAPAGALAWPQRAAALMLAPLRQRGALVGIDAAPPRSAAVALVRAALRAVVEAGSQASFVASIDETQAAALIEAVDGAEPGQRTGTPLGGAAKARPLAAPRSARDRLSAVMRRLQATDPARAQECCGIAAADSSSMVLPAAHSIAPPVDATAPDMRGAIASAAGANDARGRQAVSAAAAEATLDGAESGWAGLWLLLPMLLRHGLAAADDPRAAWADAWGAACRRFAVPDDDPVRADIGALGLPIVESPGLWLRRARLAAVRDARLPLRSIVKRRGIAWVSSQRIDVAFAASAADVRIRRAGFDIDPGFVPWLDRVVHFHYA